jgi:hypothetical protein
METGRIDEAIIEFNETLRYAPSDQYAQRGLSSAMSMKSPARD